MEEIPANESILHFEIMKTSVHAFLVSNKTTSIMKKLSKSAYSFTKIGCEAQ